MKTLTVIFTVIFATMTTGLLANNGLAYSGDETKVNVKMQLVNENLVKISIESLVDKALVLYIYDNKGNEVMSNLINENKTRKISHNIEGLNEGFFTYMVKDGDAIVYTSRIIKSDDGSVEFRSDDSDVNASIEKVGDDRVLIRLYKKNDAKATIKVWDANGKNLYTKHVKNGDHFRLTHDYSDFPKGTYSFGVFYDGELIALRNVTK